MPAIPPIPIYLCIGALAGTLSGMLGLGGGVIVVPGLLFAFNYLGMPKDIAMHMAAGTSLASIIFCASASAQNFSHMDNVNWKTVKRFTPGILIGTFIGAKVASLLPTELLSIVFAIFVFVIAVRMFMLVKPKPGRTLPGPVATNSLSFIVGAKSGLLGIGGGALMVPFFTRCNMPMRTASGTSVTCSVIISLVGAGTLMFAHGYSGELPALSTGFVYWPAALGVAVGSMLFVRVGSLLSQRVPQNTLKRIFAVFMLIAALRMIVGAL